MNGRWRILNFKADGSPWSLGFDDRRDESQVRQRAGPNEGWTVLVDTPHLVVRVNAGGTQVYIHDDLVDPLTWSSKTNN